MHTRRLRANLTKNRYTDVLCFDHSRVILSQEDDDPTSDYINANFVDGYKQKNAYISTQGNAILIYNYLHLNSHLSTPPSGPLPKTTPDFWRMVWEQHCMVIVMTTRVLERGRIKCGQYWETTEGSSCVYGCYNVRTLNVESNEDYTVTLLELTNFKVFPRFYVFYVELLILTLDLMNRLMNPESFRIGNSPVGPIMGYRRRQWQC